MSFQERVTIFIETKVDNAKSQLSGFKQSVAEAQGATGKLKAVASGMGDALSSAVGAIASPAGLAAVGGAIVGVATKAVGAFQDLGLAVGHFRDSTGATAEQASRFVEVFDDLGIGADAGEAALGKMEKALGANADAFAKYGVQAAFAADGSVDVEQTFLNAIDALNKMPNANERAAAGNAIFGRSWQQMSEIITGGADNLKASLDAVQSSKILNDDDIAQARNLRDGFDSISDALDGLLLTLGKSLAPAVTDLANRLGEVLTQAEPAFKAFGDGLNDSLELLGPVITGVGTLANALGELNTSANKPLSERSVLDSLKRTALDAVNPLGAVKHNWDDVMDHLGKTPELAGEVVTSFDAVATSLDGTAEAAAATKQSYADAAEGLKAWTDNTAAALTAIDEQNKALLEQADALNGVADAYANAADDQVTYNDAVADLNAKLKDSKASTEDVRDAAITAAKAHAELYTSMVESSGATATATGKLDAQNQSLLATAATAKGAAKQAILDYIATLNGIPPEKMTEIQAAINRGDLAEAQRLLNEASAARTATITADAKTAQANRDLDQVARDRTATINAFIKTSGAGFMLGSTTSGAGRSATPEVLALNAPVAALNASINQATANRTVKVKFESAGIDGLLGAFLGAVHKGTSTLVRVNGGG